MKRIGQCNRCGACCTIPIINRKEKQDNSIHNDNSNRQDCEYLIRHKDGTTSCSIESSKPLICKEYPKTKEDLIYRCGFKFKK